MSAIRLAENLHLSNNLVKCSRCGHELGEQSQNWKGNAIRRSRGSVIEENLVRLHEDLGVFEYFCPGCGVLLDVEIARKDEPHQWDVQLKPKRR